MGEAHSNDRSGGAQMGSATELGDRSWRSVKRLAAQVSVMKEIRRMYE
jgi:hypothetical protein